MSYDPNMPQYGAPMGAPMGAPNFAQVEKLRSNSTIVLVLGILSFVGLGLFSSIPAWIWGGKILNEARMLGIPEETVSMAKWGRILGIINVVLTVFVLVLYIAFIIFAVVMSSHSY